MILRTTIFLLAFTLAAGTAEAMTLDMSKPEKSGTCELTCSTRPNESSAWKSTVQCYNHMTETQCGALAHHYNLNDAYPERMKCKTVITSPCTATVPD